MSERVDAFAALKDVPAFELKPRADKRVSKDAIDQIADENRFPSRQPRKEPTIPRRKPRVYRTGRSLNFSLKATVETRDRFHKAADAHGVTLARLLELALDALEQQSQSTNS
jgi:hypothetical protein